MFQTRVISDNGLKIVPSGCNIDIRIPWYRALPLSVCSVDDVQIDDRPIDLQKINFEINGLSIPLDKLRGLTDEWWFILDSAILHIEDEQLEKNTEHAISVTVSLRPPYINKLNWVCKGTKKLIAH